MTTIETPVFSSRWHRSTTRRTAAAAAAAPALVTSEQHHDDTEFGVPHQEQENDGGDIANDDDCTSHPRRRWSSLPTIGRGDHHNKKWLRRESEHLHQCFTFMPDLSTIETECSLDDDDNHAINNEGHHDEFGRIAEIDKNEKNAEDADPRSISSSTRRSDTRGRRQQQQELSFLGDSSLGATSSNNKSEGETRHGTVENYNEQEVMDDYYNNPRRYSDPASYDHRFLRRQSHALRRESQCLHQILMSVQDLNSLLLEADSDDDEVDDSWGAPIGKDCPKVVVVVQNDEDDNNQDSGAHPHDTLTTSETVPEKDNSTQSSLSPQEHREDMSIEKDEKEEVTTATSFYDAMVLRYHHAELNEMCGYLDMTIGGELRDDDSNW